MRRKETKALVSQQLWVLHRILIFRLSSSYFLFKSATSERQRLLTGTLKASEFLEAGFKFSGCMAVTSPLVKKKEIYDLRPVINLAMSVS